MANQFIARKGLISLSDAQITGSLQTTGTLTVAGATTLSSTLTAAGLSTFGDSLVFTGNIDRPSGTSVRYISGDGSAADMATNVPSSGTFIWRISGNGKMSLNSTGLSVTNALAVTGASTMSGALTVEGVTNLGGDLIMRDTDTISQSSSAVSTSGFIKCLNNVVVISSRNAAGTGNISVIGTNSSDEVTIQNTGLRIKHGSYVHSQTDFSVAAQKKIYLDGRSNTYLVESSDNVIDFYAGGANTLRLTATAATIGGTLAVTDASTFTGNVGIGTAASSPALKILETSGGQFALELEHNHATNGHGLQIKAGDDSASNVLLILDQGGSQLWKMDGEGSVAMAGTLAVTGTSTFTGDVDVKNGSDVRIYRALNSANTVLATTTGDDFTITNSWANKKWTFSRAGGLTVPGTLAVAGTSTLAAFNATGNSTVAGAFDITRATGTQLALNYDGSNYWTFGVNSYGDMTVNGTGTTHAFHIAMNNAVRFTINQYGVVHTVGDLTVGGTLAVTGNVGIGGSATSAALAVTGDTTISGNIAVTGAGPHAIGGATSNYVALRHRGSFLSGGLSTVAMFNVIDGALTGAVGDTSRLVMFEVGGTIITQGTDTNIGHVATAYFHKPEITNNLASSGKPDIAASVFVRNAPTEGDVNAALYVNSGATILRGTLAVTGDATFTGDVEIAALSVLFLDGAAHNAYIQESSTGNVRVVAGGAQAMNLTNSGVSVPGTLTVTGDTTISGDIIVSGHGPHAIGGAVGGYARLKLTGGYTGDGSSGYNRAVGLVVEGAITGAVGDTGWLAGAQFANYIVTQGTDSNIGIVAQVKIDEPVITNNLASSGKPDVAASLYITSAPTEGDVNAALYVNSGATKLGGTLTVTGDTTISGNITVSGTGPHGIGAAGTTDRMLTIAGAFASTGGSHAMGIFVAPTITVETGDVAAILYVGGTLTEFSSGTHQRFVGSSFYPPTIVAGSASVTNAATVHIADQTAASGANNYALWVNAGATKLEGTLAVTGMATFTNQIRAADGGTSEPGLSFNNDRDSGLVRNSANVVSMSTGGVQAMKWDASQNVSIPNGTLTVTGDTTISGTIAVTGAGPHAIGIAINSRTKLRIGGPFTGTGSGTETTSIVNAPGMTLQSTDTAASFLYASGTNFGSSITLPAASFTAANVGTMILFEPNIIKGAGSAVTNATTLKIASAPTEGTNNYSLWVASGATKLGGTLAVTGTSTFTGDVALSGTADVTMTSGVITTASGVVGTPALAISDATSGFYRVGTNAFAVTNAGTKTATFQADNTVDFTGNVGIGRSAGAEALEIAGSIRTYGGGLALRMDDLAASGTVYARARNDTGELIWGVSDAAGTGVFFGGASYSSVIGAASNHAFQIATNNRVRFTITSAGVVQTVGDLTVGGTLAVTSIATLSGGLSVGDTNTLNSTRKRLQFRSESQAARAYIQADLGILGDLQLVTEGNQSITLVQGSGGLVSAGTGASSFAGTLAVTGNVGIGESAGTQSLRVLQDDSNVYALVATNSHSSTPYGIEIDFSGSTPNNRVARFLSNIDDGNERSILWSDGGATFTGLVAGTSQTLSSTLTVTGNVGIGGSATSAALAVTGDTTISGDIVVSGTGPHAIGGAVFGGYAMYFKGAYTGTTGSGSAGISTYHTITNITGQTWVAGMRFASSVVTQNLSQTVNVAAQLYIVPPGITKGNDTLTNAATVYISGTPSAGTNNYALWVASGATKLGGTLAVTGTSTFTGNVGIGTTSPDSKLEIQSAQSDTMTDAEAFLALKGTGGDGLLMGQRNSSPYAAWIQAGYIVNIGTSHHYPLALQPHGGNVGIGTASPASTLSIHGRDLQLTVAGQTSSNFATTSNTLVFGDEQSGATARHQASIGSLREAWNNSPTSLIFKTSLTVNGATEKMRIRGNGNVGIGTTSPDAWLQIEKDNNNSGNQFCVADTEGVSAAVRTYTHGGDPAGLILNHYYAVGGSGNEYMRYADFVANVSNGAGTTIRFITKNAANVYSTTVIDNNGRVGIGQTSPDYKLDVNGTVNASLYLANDGTTTAPAYSFEGNTDMGLSRDGDTLQIASSNQATGRLEFTNGFLRPGNDNGLSLGSGTKGYSDLFLGSGAVINFNNGDMTITHATNVLGIAGGNVGIGTTSPLYKTHIFESGNAITGTNVDISELALVLSKGSDTNNQAIGIGFGSSTDERYVGAAIIHERTTSESVGKMHFATKSSSADDIPIRMTIDNAGKVGIGTSSPSNLLEVYQLGASNSATQLTVRGQATGYGSGILFDSVDGGAVQRSQARIHAEAADNWADAAHSDSDLVFATALNGSLVEAMRIDHTGNVGIGTASPSEKLHLVGGDMMIDSGRGIRGPGGTEQYQVHTSDGLKLRTGGNESMRIDTSGKIGIGTTGPGAALELKQPSDNVAGGLRITRSGENTYGTFFIAAGGEGQDDPIILQHSNGTRNLMAWGRDGTVIIPNGNLGIGTTNSGYSLNVAGNINIGGAGTYLRFGSGDVEITNLGSYSLGFKTYTGSALTEKMRITSAGNVGIGTTSPGYPLEVNGTILAIANIRIRGGASTPISGEARLGGHATWGAQIYGYGSTNDISLVNRAGTVVMAVLANSTTVKFAGNVGIGGSATSAALAVTGDTTISGAIGIGGSAAARYQVYKLGSVTSDGSSTNAAVEYMSTTLTGASGDTTFLALNQIDGVIVTQTATESIAYIASLAVNEPNITDNLTGDITVAATVYIKNAPTEGATNAALYVASGAVDFKGTLAVTGAATLGALSATTGAFSGTITGTGGRLDLGTTNAAIFAVAQSADEIVAGAAQYDLVIRPNTANAFRITSNGGSSSSLVVDSSGNTTLGGTLAVTGTTTLNDHVTIPYDSSASGSAMNKFLYLGTTDYGITQNIHTPAVSIRTNGNNDRFLFGASDFTMPATGKLRLDGSVSGDTYITESSADVMKFYAGGVPTLAVNSTGVEVWSAASNISLQAFKGTRFGYASTYKVLQIGSAGATTADNIAIGVDLSTNSNGAFTGYGEAIYFRNGITFRTPNSANNGWHSYITYKDGNVGIGDTTPDYKLDVNGTGRFTGAVTMSSTLAVTGTLQVNGDAGMTIGGDIALIRGGANRLQLQNGDSFTINSGGFGIGVSETTAGNLSMAGDLSITGSSKGLYFSGSNSRIYFGTKRAMEGNSAGTNLQIGEHYSALNFYGTSTFAGNVTGPDFIATSDIRLKNVIGGVTNALDTVNKLNAIRFTWKDPDDHGDGEQIGFSAQEVLELVPEAVYGSEETEYGISYGKLVPVLVEAIKELTAEVESLKKTDTHYLVHSSIEGPRADLQYRGIATLSNGAATVNLDTAAGMSEGTWEVLCRDPQVWVQNNTGWDTVRGSISGNILTINCQDTNSTAEVSWLVVAERKDPIVINSKKTDVDGHTIVEPEK